MPAPRGAGGLLARLSPGRRGAAIYVAASLVFILTDSITKTLVAEVPVVHVVFGRHVSYVLAVLLIAGRLQPRRLLATSRPWIQLARGIAMFGATAMYFLSLSLLPMAETSALGSTAPLMVVALAGPVLGERVTRPALAGAVIGFGGVVVLAGLDPTRLDAGMLAPLLSAASLAVFTLLTRTLRGDPTDVTVFLSGIVGLVAATVLEIGIPTASAPTPVEWLGIGVVGLTALTGHRLLVVAYRWARASDLAPLGYLSLLWSFLVGTLVFREPLQAAAVAGGVLIAVGGVMALRGTPGEVEVAPATADYGGPIPGDGAEQGDADEPGAPGDAAALETPPGVVLGAPPPGPR